MSNLIKWFIPLSRYFLVFWILFIIVFSSIPSIKTPKIDTGNLEIRLDYIIHLIEYGTLAFLSVLSFTSSSLTIGRKRFIQILICLLCFATLDEFHQLLIPGRTFNPVDLVFNVVGILGGLLISKGMLHRASAANTP